MHYLNYAWHTASCSEVMKHSYFLSVCLKQVVRGTVVSCAHHIQYHIDWNNSSLFHSACINYPINVKLEVCMVVSYHITT